MGSVGRETERHLLRLVLCSILVEVSLGQAFEGVFTTVPNWGRTGGGHIKSTAQQDKLHLSTAVRTFGTLVRVTTKNLER